MRTLTYVFGFGDVTRRRDLAVVQPVLKPRAHRPMGTQR